MGSRSKRPFVPTEFVVPSELSVANFTLRMLSTDDVDKDFEAVTSSAARLSQVWPDSGWPAGLTLRQNLIDLGWHEKEFQNRSSFRLHRWWRPTNLEFWAVCTFIRPHKAGYDAEVFLWVRESEAATEAWIQRLFEVSATLVGVGLAFSHSQPIPAGQISWDAMGLSCPSNKSVSGVSKPVSHEATITQCPPNRHESHRAL